MDDLISRKAAIDALFKLYEYQRDIDPTEAADLVRQGVYLAEKKIEQLPPAQQDSKETSPTHKALDTISRQAAIDALTSHIMPHNNEDGTVTIGVLSKSSIKNILNKLPSAHPEKRTEERTETHACDCIERQAAIDSICRTVCDNPEICESPCDEIKVLEIMPSAQHELPEWAQKVEEYRKSAPSFVRNQLVWALYQTWKEYDGRLVHQRGKENR